MTRIAAIIPARAGSRGINDKNLRRVKGVPLISRAVRAAKAARTVDLVVVSSDGEEILDRAKRDGARVIRRPDALADDEAASEAALLHALDVLEADTWLPDIVAFIQCTSPFVRPEDIDGTVSCVRDAEADVAFTATRWHGFIWHEGPEGWLAANHDLGIRQRRQDRPPEVLETGAVYAFDTVQFRKERHRFFGTVQPYLVPAGRALEIDGPADLEAARLLAPSLDPVPDLTSVEALVMDFDGVMTDNRVLTFTDGTEGVVAHRGDGHGLAELRRRTRMKVTVLSTETNPVVTARCEKLGVPVRQGLGAEKATALREWADAEDVDLSRTIFVGNDVNDLGCLGLVGFPICPRDAVEQVQRASQHVLEASGGHGAIRELCDLILAQREAKGSEDG